MNIGDRLGKNHLLVTGDLDGRKEYIAPTVRDNVLARKEIFRASTAMTDEELALSSMGGNNDAAEILLRRYTALLVSLARRGAKRYAMEVDECHLLARLGVWKATRIWKQAGDFKGYAIKSAVGEMRREARELSKAQGWRRVSRTLELRDRTGLTRKKVVEKNIRFATVVSDNIPTEDGGSLSYSELRSSGDNISEQIGEIIAAEQAAEQHISAWQLVKDGNVLAAFLKALPPFAKEEAQRVMRGMTIEESMAETGLTRSKVGKARAMVDRLAEEWGVV